MKILYIMTCYIALHLKFSECNSNWDHFLKFHLKISSIVEYLSEI